MFEAEITSDKPAPVIADALGRYRRSPMTIAEVPSIITCGAKPNQADGTIFPAFHLGVRCSQVAPQKIMSTDFQQDVILADNAHTSPCLERSWLLVAGTTGDRVRTDAGGWVPQNSTIPVVG